MCDLNNCLSGWSLKPCNRHHRHIKTNRIGQPLTAPSGKLLWELLWNYHRAFFPSVLVLRACIFSSYVCLCWGFVIDPFWSPACINAPQVNLNFRAARPAPPIILEWLHTLVWALQLLGNGTHSVGIRWHIQSHIVQACLVSGCSWKRFHVPEMTWGGLVVGLLETFELSASAKRDRWHQRHSSSRRA